MKKPKPPKAASSSKPNQRTSPPTRQNGQRTNLRHKQNIRGFIINIWQRLSEVQKISVKVCGVAAIIYSTYSRISPNISISTGVIGENGSSTSVEFVIKNEGVLPVYNNKITCIINSPGIKNARIYGNVFIGPEREIRQDISVLEKGATATRNCSSMIYLPIPATFDLTIMSNWPWPLPILSWETKGYFVSLKDSSGKYQVVPDSR